MPTAPERIAEAIVAARDRVPPTCSALAAISGIDGSGKGWASARVAEALRARGLSVAEIHIDGWLNLPQVRIDRSRPAENFYDNAIRFADLFARLVLPLRDCRSIALEYDFAEETATSYRRERCEFRDVDAIVIEGIFLLKRELRAAYDVSFWLDCTFDTALERALARGQEHLSREDTIRDYRTIYFPAQEIHLRRDQPRSAAAAVIANDPRLDARLSAGGSACASDRTSS